MQQPQIRRRQGWVVVIVVIVAVVVVDSQPRRVDVVVQFENQLLSTRLDNCLGAAGTNKARIRYLSTYLFNGWRWRDVLTPCCRRNAASLYSESYRAASASSSTHRSVTSSTTTPSRCRCCFRPRQTTWWSHRMITSTRWPCFIITWIFARIRWAFVVYCSDDWQNTCMTLA